MNPSPMPRNKRIIPLAPLIRAFYTDDITRVSLAAAKHLSEWLEDYGLELSKEAIKISKESGRKTVKDSDFKLVLKIKKEKI